LNNKLRDIFILYDKDNKIGTVRFDRFDRKKYAEISITIKPDVRGKGYGSTAIKLLSEFYLEEYDLDYISALIKPFNETSSKSFAKAGYIYDKKYEDRLEYVYVRRV
jgi:RimJ/RimL family protein N-acetyltransferase